MTRLAVVIGIAVVASGVSQTPAVRFHHVHYRVGDPATAMNAAALALEGTRVVVSGLGVGVRVGNEFVLYDRLDETDAPDLLQRTLPHAFEAARSWLLARGIAVSPDALSFSRVTRAPAARYHHVAFVTSEFEAVVARIAATAVRTTSESALFDAGGVLVEIVRESGLPDAFWCPMHPDVRSASAGKCPACGMDLVPMPPPRVGEYRLDVVVKSGRHGAAAIRLTVREPQTNAVVRTFTQVHEKFLHLFIVSRDLEYFAHVHPLPSPDGSFHIEHALPAGEYMFIADFLPAGGTTQMVQRAVIWRGQIPTALRSVVAGEDPSIRVELQAGTLAVGREGRLTFSVRDAATGAAVTDLEPFLGAAAHLLMVRGDLGDAMHEHPEEQVAGGPMISFHPLIPAPGDYKLWLQVQRRGRVLTFPFRLRAE